jgi:hypothetical protein
MLSYHGKLVQRLFAGANASIVISQRAWLVALERHHRGFKECGTADLSVSQIPSIRQHDE